MDLVEALCEQGHFVSALDICHLEKYKLKADLRNVFEL